MSYSVFISYSSKDLLTVDKIKKLLNYPGIEVFISEYSKSPGKSLVEKIIENIKKCNTFILIWSPAAKNSDWVREEIAIARSKNKKIIPIVLKKRSKLPNFIEDLEYLPLYKSTEDTMEWLHKNILESAREKQIKDTFVLIGFLGFLAFLFTGGKK